MNNVVDGRALSQEESFGFECNSGRSLWSGNLVYDMPNEAFVVRSGYENTFMNNLIVNAKVGFALSGQAPGQGELISGNRFINVEHPIALDRNLQPACGADVYLPGAVRMEMEEDLPEPSPEWLGRQIVRGEKLYLCVQSAAGAPRWMEISGSLLPVRVFKEIGPELALNADQSATEPLGIPELDRPLHRGWRMGMLSSNERGLDPADGHVSYDQENFQTGTQSLKVAFQGVSGNWSLSQDLSLEAGKRYRASALVRGEEPLNLRLWYRMRLKRTSDACGAPVGPAAERRFCYPAFWQNHLAVWSSKTNEGKAAWLDSVSVKELQEGELDESGQVIVRPQQIWEEQGENLLINADFQALSQALEGAEQGGLPKWWPVCGA